MLFDVDTNRMQSMMSVLQQANAEIDSALELLNLITIHDEWYCKEKIIINEYILENRALIQKLQTECDNFCKVAISVVEDFINIEKRIAESFHSVDDQIAQILQNPVSRIVVNGQVTKTLSDVAIRTCSPANLTGLFR